jgi:hypothetical protein
LERIEIIRHSPITLAERKAMSAWPKFLRSALRGN